MAAAAAAEDEVPGDSPEVPGSVIVGEDELAMASAASSLKWRLAITGADCDSFDGLLSLVEASLCGLREVHERDVQVMRQMTVGSPGAQDEDPDCSPSFSAPPAVHSSQRNAGTSSVPKRQQQEQQQVQQGRQAPGGQVKREQTSSRLAVSTAGSCPAASRLAGIEGGPSSSAAAGGGGVFMAPTVPKDYTRRDSDECSVGANGWNEGLGGFSAVLPVASEMEDSPQALLPGECPAIWASSPGEGQDTAQLQNQHLLPPKKQAKLAPAGPESTTLVASSSSSLADGREPTDSSRCSSGSSRGVIPSFMKSKAAPGRSSDDGRRTSTSGKRSAGEAKQKLQSPKTTVVVATPTSRHHGEVQAKLKEVWAPWLKASSKLVSHQDTGDSKQDLPQGMNWIMDTNHKTAVQMAPTLLQMFIAHPSSRWRLSWDALGMFFLMCDLIVIPLQAFQGYVDLNSRYMVSFAMLSSSYWATDMLASFLVGYHTQAHVEMNPFKIAKHYLRTWFVIDAALIFVDWGFILIGMSQNVSFMRIGKTLSRGMRVLRLLRIVKMHGVVTGIMEKIHNELVRTFLSIIFQVLVIILVNHFFACGWYGLSHVDNTGRNWRTYHFTAEEHDNLSYRYATSLHWSLTQFTPAGMEVMPKNSLERWYSVFVLLFALVTFSSFVSSITQAMTHLKRINAQRLEEETRLRRYLNQHGISGKLVNTVWHYLHQREIMNSCRTRTKESDVQALEMLPKSMKYELRFESFSPILKRHPFFWHYGFSEPAALKQICHSAISEISLLSKQELFSDAKGELVQLFFVQEGSLEYRLPCQCAKVEELQEDELDDDDDDEEPMSSLSVCVGGGLKKSSSRLGSHFVHVLDKSLSQPGKPATTISSGSGVSFSAQAASAALIAPKRAGNADQIRSGQWACEAALWSQKVELYGPFVAHEKSELLMVNTEMFQEIALKHESSRSKVAKYGESFVGHVPEMCNCRWRTGICNDFSTIEDIVQRHFEYSEPLKGKISKPGASRLSRSSRWGRSSLSSSRSVVGTDEGRSSVSRVAIGFNLFKRKSAMSGGCASGGGSLKDIGRHRPQPPDPSARESRTGDRSSAGDASYPLGSEDDASNESFEAGRAGGGGQ